MSAYSNLITLTQVSPSPAGTIRLAAAQIIKVLASGSGAKVMYWYNGSELKTVIVSETPAAIYTASQMLVSLDVSGGPLYVNANLIIKVTTSAVVGFNSHIEYLNPNSPTFEQFDATETPAAIQTAVAAIVGSGGGIPVTGLTAHAGGGQALATQLSFGYNEVTTVASSGDSVKLQPAQAGAVTVVLNDGANPMDVFPATGDTINDGAANAAISLAPGVSMTFTAIDSTNWETGVQTIETNSLKELTPGAGVDVQSRMIFEDVNNYSTTTGITAFAGGGQGSATALTKSYNVVTVCATEGDSVKLLPAVVGLEQTVKNIGATPLDIFPNTGDAIDSGAVDAAVRIPRYVQITFKSIDGVTWQTQSQVTISFSGHYTDFITEKTLGAGTTFTKKAIFSEANVYSNETGITAFATGGQASATALTKQYNNITTCATAGDSVKLLAAVAGMVQVVTNSGATAADVFPNSGDSINGGAVDAAIRIAVGETIVFSPIDGTDWKASFAGAGNAGNPSLPVGTKNKGFYEVSANQIGGAVNGGLVMTFDTLGMTSDSLRNRVNLGTTPVGTVSIVEYGDGKDITTVLTLTNFIIGALAGAAADLAIGNIVYAFPAGQHLELVYALSSISLTAAGTAVATDTGLGSVIASGAVNVLSGTATFEDRLTGQTANTAPGGGAAVSALTAATAGIGAGIALNVAGSVKNVFLNSAGSWNVDNVGDLTASGTIVLKWSRMQ